MRSVGSRKIFRNFDKFIDRFLQSELPEKVVTRDKLMTVMERLGLTEKQKTWAIKRVEKELQKRGWRVEK